MMRKVKNQPWCGSLPTDAAVDAETSDLNAVKVEPFRNRRVYINRLMIPVENINQLQDLVVPDHTNFVSKAVVRVQDRRGYTNPLQKPIENLNQWNSLKAAERINIINSHF